MKQFKQFLTESEDSVDDLLEKIKKDCKPFLSIMKNFEGVKGSRWLLRGMHNRNSEAPRFSNAILGANGIVDSKHPVREPVDSDQDFNNMFNAAFYMAYDKNEPIVRRHSIFCTANYNLAGTFGNIYLLFPKGEFKFLWSPDIHDSWSNESTFATSVIDHVLEGDEGDSFTTIAAAINYQIKEAMLACRSLTTSEEIAAVAAGGKLSEKDLQSIRHDLVARFGESRLKEITDEQLLERIQKLAKGFELAFKQHYKLDDFLGALKSRNEILIYESGGYYAVKMTKLGSEWVSQDFHGDESELIYGTLREKLFGEKLRVDNNED